METIESFCIIDILHWGGGGGEIEVLFFGGYNHLPINV